jgi:hypothetical protein
MELLAIPGGNPAILDTHVKLGLAFGSPGTGSQQQPDTDHEGKKD